MKKDKELNIASSGDGLNAVRSCFIATLKKAGKPDLTLSALTANEKKLEEIMVQVGGNTDLYRELLLCFNKLKSNS